MTQMMVCPPSPLGYTQYERRYYAGDWWYRISPESPWQLCKEEAAEEADETWDYMEELLEAGEISFEDFRHQMLSAGYSEEEIARAA